MTDQNTFRLRHSDASAERTLAAAERVEAAVGALLNGNKRALGRIDPGDLALLVQYARNAEAPPEPLTMAALTLAIAKAEAEAAQALRDLLRRRAQEVWADPCLDVEYDHRESGGPPDRKRWRVFSDGCPVGYGVSEAEALLSAIEGAWAL